MEGRMGTAKVRTLGCGDQDSLISEEKDGRGKKWCIGSGHPPRSRPLPTLFPVFVAEHDVIWPGVSLWSVLARCPNCVPSSCPPLAYLLKWVEWGEMKPWGCASTAARAKAGVCYQHCSRHKAKAKHHLGCCEESYLHLIQLQYSKKAVFFLTFDCSFGISIMWFISSVFP